MCIEDIAISRRCYQRTTRFTASTSTRIPANPDRIAIRGMVDLLANGGIVFAPTTEDATLFKGWVVARTALTGPTQLMNDTALVMDYKEFGPLVQGEIWVFSSYVNPFYTEVIMMPELANDVREMIKAKGW